MILVRFLDGERGRYDANDWTLRGGDALLSKDGKPVAVVAHYKSLEIVVEAVDRK